VQLADGRTLVKEVEFPRGHALNPMTDAEVEQKFRRLVEPRYGKDQATRILAACWDLEKLPAAGELMRLVAGTGQTS
jgi:2-methylcitrate dehydratase